jgi:hypothetical protein
MLHPHEDYGGRVVPHFLQSVAGGFGLEPPLQEQFFLGGVEGGAQSHEGGVGGGGGLLLHVLQ